LTLRDPVRGRQRPFFAWPRGWVRGSAALEFSLVAGPLLALTVVICELAYDFYCQEVLDYATQSAARQIQIGTAQAAPGGAAAYIQQSVCTTLTGLLPCSGVALSSQVVTDYYNLTNVGQVPTTNGAFNSGSLSFCAGQPGQLVLLTAYYPATAILTAYLPVATVVVNGSPVRMIVSTAAFENEQFSSTGSSGC